MTAATVKRYRARGARLRALAHLVAVDTDGRQARRALCGFRPKYAFSGAEAPVWETDCPRCAAKAVTA